MDCVNGFWIIFILKFTLGEHCIETLDTVRNVSYCPRNIEEWEAASKIMNCSKIKLIENCENVTYHCLRDAVTKTMVEVCTVPRILHGHCPLFYQNPYHVRNDLARNCSKNSTCPEFYSSKDAYNYPVCYNDTSIVTAVSTSEPSSSTILNPTSTIATQITSTGGTADGEEENDTTWMKIVFPILTVFLMLIAYIIDLCYVKICGREERSWRQAARHVNQQIVKLACCMCCRRDDNGVTRADRENTGGNTNSSDRNPVQGPQTPEATTPDESNSSINGISQINSTQGTITDTTDSNTAVPENSALSLETNPLVKQDGNNAETCNRPSSFDQFSKSGTKTSADEKIPLLAEENIEESSDAKEPMGSDSTVDKRDTVGENIKTTSEVSQKETPQTEGKASTAGGSLYEDKHKNPCPGSVCRKKDAEKEKGKNSKSQTTEKKTDCQNTNEKETMRRDVDLTSDNGSQTHKEETNSKDGKGDPVRQGKNTTSDGAGNENQSQETKTLLQPAERKKSFNGGSGSTSENEDNNSAVPRIQQESGCVNPKVEREFAARKTESPTEERFRTNNNSAVPRIQQESGCVNPKVEREFATRETESPTEERFRTNNNSAVPRIQQESGSVNPKVEREFAARKTESPTEERFRTNNEWATPLMLQGIENLRDKPNTTKKKESTLEMLKKNQSVLQPRSESQWNTASSFNVPPQEYLENVVSNRTTNDFNKQMKKRSQDDASCHIDILEKSHNLMVDITSKVQIIDEKLMDLRKEESGLEGRVDFIEQTMDYLEQSIVELERDCNILQCNHIRKERGNLDKHVRWLCERFSNLDHRRTIVEAHLVMDTLSYEEKNRAMDNNIDCKTIEGKPITRVETLEIELRKLEERVCDLQKSRFGKKGSVEGLKRKINYLGGEVIKLEKENNRNGKPIGDMESVHLKEQLLKMEIACKDLISRLETLEKNL